MRGFFKVRLMIAAISVGVALCAPSPDASNAHYVIINNSDISGNNYGTVMKLAALRKILH